MGQIQFGRIALQSPFKIIPPQGPQNRVVRSERPLPGGDMALRGKKLVCHGCNKKSNIVYDGRLREWDCKTCDNTNYLDENGEIADTPVNELAFAPSPVTSNYASSSRSNSPEPNSIFCTTCVKNQHLHNASVQQYEIDLSIVEKATPMQWARASKRFEDYKRNLDRRYPLICADCEPRALERMKQAGYLTKADNLRRNLDRTKRRNKIVASDHGLLSLHTFSKVGKTSIVFAFIVQIMWNLSALALFYLHRNDIFSVESLYHSDSPLAQLGPLISSYLPYTAWLAVGHFYWCPRLRDLWFAFVDGMPRHIRGFANYYILQTIFICFRILFCVFAAKLDSVPESWFLLGHSVMLISTILLALRMPRVIFVDLNAGQLWTSPEKFPFVGPSSGSPIDSMEKELNRIHASFTQRPITPPSPTNDIRRHFNPANFYSPVETNPTQRYPSPPIQPFSLRKSPDTSHERKAFTPRPHNIPRKPSPFFNPQPSTYGTQSSFGTPEPQPSISHAQTAAYGRQASPYEAPSIQLPPRTTPSMSAMTPEEALHYLKTGTVPDRLQGTYNDLNSPTDTMEWSPEASQHRAFKSVPASERASRTSTFGRPLENTKEFSQAPITEQSSAFWFKVPPAPISQAHRLRNPPNQPVMRAASEEVKQNFFRSNKGTNSALKEMSLSEDSTYMAQPKFFAPEKQDGAREALIDLLGGFSLKEEDEPRELVSSSSSLKSRATVALPVLGAVVACGVWQWMS